MNPKLKFLLAIVLFLGGLLLEIDGSSEQQVGIEVAIGLGMMIFGSIIIVQLDKTE